MAAIHVSQSVFNKDYSEKLSLIFKNARGDNPIVNTYMESARDGAYSKRFRDIIIALYRGNLLEIKHNTPRLLEAGKTSGIDWAVGFYLTLMTELNGAKD